MIGIQYAWDDVEKTVIRMYIGDLWDWDDFASAMDGIASAIREVEHQVDIISVMRTNAPVPDGNIFQHLKDALARMPRHVGVHVMVGGNPLCNRSLRMLTHSYRCMTGRLFQTNALGEAYRIIARNRPEVYDAFDAVA